MIMTTRLFEGIFMTLDICLAMIVSAMFYRNYKACEREQKLKQKREQQREQQKQRGNLIL